MSQVRPLLALVALSLVVPATAQAHVLRVGTYNGHRGSYRTIQRAVNAAHAGDSSSSRPASTTSAPTTRGPSAEGGTEAGAGVWIQTPGIHLRGMDRNGVVVDGTKPGGAGACSRRKQRAGPRPARQGRQAARAATASRSTRRAA